MKSVVLLIPCLSGLSISKVWQAGILVCFVIVRRTACFCFAAKRPWQFRILQGKRLAIGGSEMTLGMSLMRESGQKSLAVAK